MSGHALHDASMIGTGVTFGGGVMVWLGSNANAIGAIVAILSLALTGIFLFLNYRLNLKRLEFDRREALKDEK